jgi:hypothetical protein
MRSTQRARGNFKQYYYMNFAEELRKMLDEMPNEIISEKMAKYNTEQNDVGPTAEDFLAGANKSKQVNDLTAQWLKIITDAGFVKLTKGDIVVDIPLKILESNTRTACYFHASVLDMPEHEQKEQPWIEHHVFAKWLNYPDAVEGRFGSMRFPFTTLEKLQSFMQTFGYTDTKQLNP